MPEIKRCAVTLFFLLLISACSSEEESAQVELPDHISQLENVTVFSPNIQPADTVVLEKVATFESSDDIYMEGRLSSFNVDDRDRVYIAATQIGRLGVYVFNPNGEYITRIAPYGRGPGEYESIRSIDVHDNKLYLLDARLQKFGTFELDSFTHVEDHIITRNRLTESDSLAKMFNFHDLIVNNDQSHILALRMFPRSRKFASQTDVYYPMEAEGSIPPNKLLELKGLTYYYPPEGMLSVPYLMPFNRSSLVSVSSDGHFYTAWSEDFLINVYDQYGTYLRAIYYPAEQAEMSLDEITLEREQERMLDQYDLPETWPAVHTMELDDEGRLWVATITESDSTFQWHVLDKDGTQLARFTLPGRRASRSAYSKPLIQIKNGYYYNHEQDFRTGIDRIVKYRIQFESR